jgi:hypothetical protein
LEPEVEKDNRSGSSGNSAKSGDSDSSRARYYKEKRLGQQEHCQNEGCIKEASIESDNSVSYIDVSKPKASEINKPNNENQSAQISPSVLFSPESRLDELIENKSFEQLKKEFM